MTRGNEAEAEDLVQDAFIDFIHSRPDLSAVRNLEGLLYTILRNIHRSQLQKHLRRRGLLLAAIDYDSADVGLRAADAARILEVRQQLHRICQFACERKQSSKAGSLLILRFFHGYYPTEIAAITRWDRATVDARLALVRREARAYVEGPDRLREIGRPAKPSPDGEPAGFECEAVLRELRSRIFSAAEGDCPSKTEIRNLYRGRQPDTLGRDFLSHLVSCESCLDIVNRLLGLGSSSLRGFGDSDGPQSPIPMIQGQRKPRPKKAEPGKWKRNARAIAEHVPRELMIVVNGAPKAWQTVTSGRNEFSVRLQPNDPVEFVEVYSEQDVRLLSLLSSGNPPDVDCELCNEVFLTENRRLSVALRFETLGPEIHVSYMEPGKAEAPARLLAAPVAEPARRRWRDLFRPQLVLLAIALFGVAALLLKPTRETTASAATLLMKAEAWERSAGIAPGQVAHRSLKLEERQQGRSGFAVRRRVEIWRDGRKDARVRRLYDEGGNLLASTTDANTARPSSPDDVWKFEPSAGNFELLAGDLSQIKMAADGELVQLTAPSAGLTIQRQDGHAVAGFVVLAGREYQFTETVFELVRTEASPFAVPAVEGRRPAGTDVTASIEPVVPSALDIEEVEMECRYALHRIGADVGYPIEIRRNSTGGAPALIVSGVAPSAERRDEMQRALSGFPVKFELKTEDELAQEALPPAASSSEIRVASARSPIEKQLLSYFGDPVAVEKFTQAALAANERLMSHAWALRRLSERYPPSQPGITLTPAARRRLDEMNSDHRMAMIESLTELSGCVEPALLSFVGRPPPSRPSGTLFAGAHRVEQMVIALLSNSAPNGATAEKQADEAARELLAAVGGLLARLQEVQ